MVYTKLEDRWVISYTDAFGTEIKWDHPLTTKSTTNGKTITITEEILQRIFPDSTTADNIIHAITNSPNGTYFDGTTFNA